jgi:hypothetical protein
MNLGRGTRGVKTASESSRNFGKDLNVYWNYRVMRHRRDDYEWLDIREVHYDEDTDEIRGWTADPIGPEGEEEKDIAFAINGMAHALKKPILNEWELPGYEDDVPTGSG